MALVLGASRKFEAFVASAKQEEPPITLGRYWVNDQCA
jgi:hypothetical protein